MTHPFDLSGKVAVISGGNSGIGLGYAEAIARAGGDVVIWGRRDDRNRRAAEICAAHGGRTLVDTVDVSDEQAQVRGFHRVVSELGRVDCVIANAGFAGYAPLVDVGVEEYDAMMNVAQRGAFITLREGARQMIKRVESGDPGGCLIATGSLTNFLATWGVGPYGAAKSAVGSLIRNFALELGVYGIRANMICAGLIETEMVPFDNESDMGKQAREKIPLGRMGHPDDLGGIVGLPDERRRALSHRRSNHGRRRSPDQRELAVSYQLSARRCAPQG